MPRDKKKASLSASVGGSFGPSVIISLYRAESSTSMLLSDGGLVSLE